MSIEKTILSNTRKAVEKTANVRWHRFGKKDSRKFFAPINLKKEDKIVGGVKLSFERPEDVENKCCIKIINNSKEILGKEIISLYEDMKYIYGYNISVQPQYRTVGSKSKYRFGEILRVGSVLTMLKNKYKAIKIYSLNDAIYFHSKYKFEPNIEELKEAQTTLDSIIRDTSVSFSDLRKKALSLLLKMPKSVEKKEKQSFFEKVNALVKEYIERALKEGKNGEGHMFTKGFDMILTEDMAKKEAKFFNKLFKKHGIDYKI